MLFFSAVVVCEGISQAAGWCGVEGRRRTALCNDIMPWQNPHNKTFEMKLSFRQHLKSSPICTLFKGSRGDMPPFEGVSGRVYIVLYCIVCTV